MALSAQFGLRFFALDNHSDQVSIQYASKFIEEAESVLVVIWQDNDGPNKGFQAILNALLKKGKDAKLLTNVASPFVDKLAKKIPTNRLKTTSELWSKLKEY